MIFLTDGIVVLGHQTYFDILFPNKPIFEEQSKVGSTILLAFFYWVPLHLLLGGTKTHK